MRPVTLQNMNRLDRLLACLILALGSLLHSPAADAKEEFRSIAWSWCIYDCSYSGDHETAGAALSAWNAAQDQKYDACVSAANACGMGCIKNNAYGATRMTPGLTTILNGQPNLLNTTNNVTTIFTPACGAEGARFTTSEGGGIAVYGKTSCPDSGGWGGAAGPISSVDTPDGQVTSYDMWCMREIPDCPSCRIRKPLYGDPMSPVDLTQTENEVDYASADGLLRVRRIYSSAGGGRWTWSDAGTTLADFTGRSPTISADTTIPGSVWGVAPGIYPDGVLPRTSLARKFTLLKTQPDTGQKEVWIAMPNGTRTVFTESSPGTFSTNAVERQRLDVSVLADGRRLWTLKTPSDGYFVFDESGVVIERTRPDGKSLTYARSAGALSVTSTPGGRTVTYGKDPLSGAITSVRLPDATELTYGVDPFGAITSVTFGDATKKRYVYNEPAYTGTTTGAPLLLTGLIDEAGVRLATFTYAYGASPLATERAAGVDRHAIPRTYDYATATTVTMPMGSTSDLRWETGIDGERRLTSQTQAAGAGSAAATRTVDYDSAGNVTQEVDFGGRLTCYANDAVRNLESSRVEGVTNGSINCSALTPANTALPSGSRKISTLWHPDWQLQAAMAEPGRITTSVYNGQPDPFNANALASCAPSTALLPDGKPIAVLCKKVEQATTDADGHLGFSAALQSGVANRMHSWTYNEYGQVLSATDALNNTTTYAYYSNTSFSGADPHAIGHTQGDLQSVTNAKGQVTSYTQYDKHGNVRELTDPNGIATSNTYDLRQRLLSTTVGGQTTSFSYDAAGQLLKVTAPDGSWVGYEYDAAHRQVATKDSRGNRIEYTLDNAGNRVAENVKDPSGALARTLARSVDALGRVQQTTGRE